MINITQDYNKFKRFFLNRSLQKYNLDRLKHSLEKDNLLSLNPIIVTHDFEILDGQHRFEAAKELNLPIHYIQMPKSDLKDLVRALITLNYSLSKWGIYQFSELYCKLDKPEYLKFKKFYEEFDLELDKALPLTALKSKQKKLSEIFRRGEFVFSDEEKVYEIVRNGIEFLETSKSLLLLKALKPHLTSQFFQAYAKLMDAKEFNQEKMIQQLKKYGVILLESRNMTNYYTQLKALLIKR